LTESQNDRVDKLPLNRLIKQGVIARNPFVPNTQDRHDQVLGFKWDKKQDERKEREVKAKIEQLIDDRREAQAKAESKLARRSAFLGSQQTDAFFLWDSQTFTQQEQARKIKAQATVEQKVLAKEEAKVETKVS